MWFVDSWDLNMVNKYLLIILKKVQGLYGWMMLVVQERKLDFFSVLGDSGDGMIVVIVKMLVLFVILVVRDIGYFWVFLLD